MSDESTTTMTGRGDDDEQRERWTRLKRRITTFAAGVGLLAIASLGARWLDHAVESSGEVDYCWIEVETETPTGRIPRVTYALRGHRPYRRDPLMGVFDTFELAQGAAESVEGCHQKKTP